MRIIKGCLAGVVLLAFGVVLIGYFVGKSVKTSAPLTVHEPKTVDSNQRPSPPPARPPGLPPAPQLAPTPDLETQVVAANKNLAAASKELDGTRQAALAKLHADVAYQTAKSNLDDWQKQVDSSSASPTALVTAGQNKLEAKRKLTKLEADALAADPAFASAANKVSLFTVALSDVNAQLAQKKSAELQQQYKAEEAARREAEARQATLEADPTYQAIKRHQIIVGMTQDQVIDSIGNHAKETSQIGNATTYEWQRVIDGNARGSFLITFIGNRVASWFDWVG